MLHATTAQTPPAAAAAVPRGRFDELARIVPSTLRVAAGVARGSLGVETHGEGVRKLLFSATLTRNPAKARARTRFLSLALDPAKA